MLFIVELNKTNEVKFWLTINKNNNKLLTKTPLRLFYSIQK
jgi:hypothetical protein